MSHPILLYDGVCGLCNRFVQFILRRDPDGVFRFASLQSPLAACVLGRHGKDPQGLDTVYLVVDYELASERVLARSDAVIFVLKQLADAADLFLARRRSMGHAGASVPTRPTLWRLIARFIELIPLSVRNWGYLVIARHRYRLFGRYDACPAREGETKSRFLDD
jgi:predicted DCC family thiol-disulfide oxidoreductase YuxK